MEVLIVVIWGQRLGQFPVSDRFLSKFKGNGNQFVVRTPNGYSRPHSKFKLRHLFERGTPRHFPSQEGDRVALMNE